MVFILAVISFSTVKARVSTTKPLLHESEETLEEFLSRLYAELMEAYILHHNTELYAKYTTANYLLIVEIGLIEDRELVLNTVENLDFTAVIIDNEEFLHHGDIVILI